MTGFLRALLRSLAFLTRLPPLPGAFAGEHRLGDDSHAFPVAGLLIAAPAALLVLALDGLDFSAPVAALFAVAATIGLTGALHEDGLGDVADGLFGHHARERAIEIMKDSRIGTYGALALILSVLARIALVAELIGHGAGIAAPALLAAASASRGAMAHLWASLPSADPGGLAASVGAPSLQTGRLALGIGAAILVILGALTAGLGGLLLPLAMGTAAHAAFRRFLKRRLGGQTGDTIGADQQIVEIAILFGFALAI